MAHKTITISEEAYEILASHKMKGESFTEEIKRLLGHAKRGSILKHRGKWVMSDEEFDRLFKELRDTSLVPETPAEARTRSA
ncbi:MAG: antitoxin VapB family protein [Candidatus Bathyarchaeota archaeon]|nr:antitoxin VapB family protein [Candidatus Bathyarchaeota archaeon]